MSALLGAFAVLVLLILHGHWLADALRIADSPQDAVGSAMKADQKYPQLSQEIKYTNLFVPDLGAYVDDPKTECTIIAADNKAITNTMEALGKHVGLFLQNKTMQTQVLNHHVIPGKRIKAADMGTTVKAALTRANQTLWFVNKNGRPYASFGEEYVVPIQIADIKARGCILHIISDVLLVPPTLLPVFEEWQQLAGKPMALAAPKADWRPAMAPVPGAIQAAQPSAAADNAAAAKPSNAAPTAVSKEAGKAATSSGLTRNPSSCGMLLAAVLAVVQAVL